MINATHGRKSQPLRFPGRLKGPPPSHPPSEAHRPDPDAAGSPSSGAQRGRWNLIRDAMIVTLFIGGGLAAPAAEPTAEEYQAFIDAFFSSENIANYITTIDELVDAGSAQISPDPVSVEAGDGPAARVTANEIRMVFSIYHTDRGLVYHLALSREAHLPRDFAATLVAAFADRAGLMLPRVVKAGAHGDYHVVWEVPRDRIEMDAQIVAELRAKSRQRHDPQEVFSDATINARNIRIETLIP